MSDYFDRVERQLAHQATSRYGPSASRSPVRVRHADAHRMLRRAAHTLEAAFQRGNSAHPDRRSRLGFGAYLAGAVAGVGGLVAVLVMSFGASVTPERLVARGKGGLVTITAADGSSVGALNRRLASLGIPVRAAAVLPGCVAPVWPVTRGQQVAGARTLDVAGMAVVSHRRPWDRLGLVARALPPLKRGLTLVLAVGDHASETVGQVVVGSAPRCVRGRHRAVALSGAVG